MRNLTKSIVVAVLTAGLVGAFTLSAPAAVAEKKSVKKFCTKLYKVQTDPDLTDTSDLQGSAENQAKAYKKASKLAPTKKIREATKTIAEYYERLSGLDDFSSPEANYKDEESEAIETLSTYVTTKCLKIVVTTLPGS
jgi:hypothetical protein